MSGVNTNLTMGVIPEVAGLACSHIYYMDQGHLCPRCSDAGNLSLGLKTCLILEKKLSSNDTTDSHGLYILKKDEHKVPEANFLFFDHNMQRKELRFSRGKKYFLGGEGWKEFVDEKMLDKGDTVKIFELRCQRCEEIRGCMIQVEYEKLDGLTFGVRG